MNDTVIWASAWLLPLGAPFLLMGLQKLGILPSPPTSRKMGHKHEDLC